MNSTNKNEQDDIDGYTSKPYDFSQLSGAGGNVNPALVGPLFGLPSQLPGPEYLEYNIAGRSWGERMFYNTGTLYLLGIVLGGSFGFVEGFRTAPSTKFNIRLNSVLNKCGRRGSRLGNALGSVAFIYSLLDGAGEYARIEKYTGMEWVNPVLSATLTGMLYKSTQGPKTIAVAGGLGASLAAASFLAKTFLPPRPGNSKGLLFF
jgi:import inner membrane translocase subunit TIM23